MAKLLSQRDWNFNDIGTTFELDEVIPVYETEHRADENGEVIKDREGKARNFQTETLIGYTFSITILDGQFKKKSTQVKVLDTTLPITNDEIMKRDSVKCTFKNLQASMISTVMYYKADSITLVTPK